MRKYWILILMLGAFTLSLQAQQSQTDRRTLETRLADLLMQLPAEDTPALNKVVSELTALGEPAVVNLASQLNAPGEGNDTPFRFALSGMVKFAAQSKGSAQMQSISAGLAQAIQQAKNDEVKDFLLQELQYVACGNAMPAITPLLTNRRLADPAVRVALRIDNDEARSAIAGALKQKDEVILYSIVQAIGELQYDKVGKELSSLAKTKNPELRRVVYRAMAETAYPQAEKILANAAKNAGYNYEPVDAISSYLCFLDRKTRKGQSAVPALLTLSGNSQVPVHTRSAALQLIFAHQPPQGIAKAISLLDSDDVSLRNAALFHLGNNYSEEMAGSLRNLYYTTDNPALKADLLNMMVRKKDERAAEMVTHALLSDHSAVAMAAIYAVSELGLTEVIPNIIKTLQEGSKEVIAAAKEALLILEGASLANTAASALSTANGDARVALIEIIGLKMASQHTSLLIQEIESGVAAEAAAIALGLVANENDRDRIAALLIKKAGTPLVSPLQQALAASLAKLEPQQQIEKLKGLINQAGNADTLYYPVLARTGGSEALALISGILKNGTAAQRKSATSALWAWSDASAMPLLLQISHTSKEPATATRALNSFVTAINRSDLPADQKVLMLRNAMELATQAQVKRNIINQTAQHATLPALAFVSRYMDDPDTEQAAVQAVLNIVMANKGLYGPVVREWVDKAVALNKNGEADYQKEAITRHLSTLPSAGGYVSMFNGIDLTGWKGLVENPVKRGQMSAEELAAAQKLADERMRRDWRVENGILIFEGEGYDNLCSEKMYADFELFVDWKMEPKGDGGVYLRGSPQVQTWDTSRVQVGAQVGSGGLYNNRVNRSTPLLVADNPINEWNTFRIVMIGDKVTVYLNGLLVTDNVTLENFWDRSIPIFDKESIELQAHGTKLEFRDIYVREIARPEPYRVSEEEAREGFVPMFNGLDLAGWTGNKVDYFAQSGMLVCQPTGRGHGNLFTEKEYADFIMRFEFQLTPGANNGLGIRTPLEGDAAYVGMELQILDNEAEIYRNLAAYQYHGSVYGVIPAKRGFLLPVGEWNFQEVRASGSRITIVLNGEVILDGDLVEASRNGTIDNRPHPGLLNPKGHIGFLGHGSPLKFRNLRIKEL